MFAGSIMREQKGDRYIGFILLLYSDATAPAAAYVVQEGRHDFVPGTDGRICIYVFYRPIHPPIHLALDRQEFDCFGRTGPLVRTVWAEVLLVLVADDEATTATLVHTVNNASK